MTLNKAPIAIVGLGTMFAGRGTTSGFWRDIVEGADTTSDIPDSHFLTRDFYNPDPSVPDKVYVRRGAFIPHFSFDPVKFGTPPQVVETTDTVQLIALYVAQRVLERAQKGTVGKVDPKRTSVILGVAAGTELIGDMASRLNRPVWIQAMLEHGLAQGDAEQIADRIVSNYTDWRESTFPGLLGNVVAGRIANRFNLGGTNFTADAACASSLAAVRHAVQELWLGESDMVLAGGADALNNIFMYMCFSKTPAMSETGSCRPFSADCDGTLMGEGCGILALRRLEDAERDGNEIHAVLRGIGASSDGRGTSIYAPKSDGQALAITRAYDEAGYTPRTVELMEAHGTGTRVGDAVEFAGLQSVFQPAAPTDRNWCALGSVKSQIGHTKSAAGAASLSKMVNALHHKVLPPTINIGTPNPKLNIANSAFYLSEQARPWVRGNDFPRRASVSSFGFGGSNFHVTLEEYRGEGVKPPRLRILPNELFLFSGDTVSEICTKIEETLDLCESEDALAFNAWESQEAFEYSASHRGYLVAGSVKDLRAKADKIQRAANKGVPLSVEGLGYESRAADRGKTAFVFAGQGSQYIGMGAQLALHFDKARKAWDRAADYASLGSADLHRIAFPPPAFDDDARKRQFALLTQTQNAQPAITLVGMAQLSLLKELGIEADCMAGHSVGEIMALHAAGALTEEAALKLARDRGIACAMAAKQSGGRMIAVFAKEVTVSNTLAQLPGKVYLANLNTPDQFVLAGSEHDTLEAQAAFEAKGIKVVPLNVSAAFHSPLVEAAYAPLKEAILESGLKAPTVPVYSNLMAGTYPRADDETQNILARHLTSPVRFFAMIETMYRDGVRTFVEVGPSDTCGRFIKAVLGKRPHTVVSLDNAKTGGVAALHNAIGGLCIAGYRVNLASLWEEAPAEEPMPKPKKHELQLNGANYNKPYPAKARVFQDDELAGRRTLDQLNSEVAGLTAKLAELSVRNDAAVYQGAKETAELAEAGVQNEQPRAAPGRIAAQPNVTETVLAIVADKTGYPVDMLDMDMDL
ncbi:type I polyketide synthase, partial [Roseibium sp. RKSG952]|uniref:type I polyketide synthase n=1 Tax=Roseibium sp. RKSG952 TaxID=2529384 RepID=UPI0012BCB8B2